MAEEATGSASGGIRFRHVVLVGAAVIFLIVGLPLLLAPPPKEFVIRFPTNEGVRKGTDVLVAGVVVGEVNSVDISSDGRGIDARVRLNRKHENSVLSPPQTRAVVRRKGVVLPMSRIEILNGGARPIEAGAVMQGSNNEVEVAIRDASAAAEKAARTAAEEIRRLKDSGVVDPAEWDAALKSARGAALKALQEADALARTTGDRFREFAESEEGMRYRRALQEIVSSIDSETSNLLRDTGGSLGRASEGLKALLRDGGSMDRRKLADHLDTLLGELQRAEEIVHDFGRGVVVDAVRGPTTGTLARADAETSAGIVAEAERP